MRKVLLVMYFMSILAIFAFKPHQSVASDSMVDVTVTGNLNIYINNKGQSESNAYYIANNTTKNCVINDITVEQMNNWELVSSDYKFQANEKKLTFIFDGNVLLGGQNTADIVVEPQTQKQCQIDAKCGIHSENITNEEVLNIIFSYNLTPINVSINFDSNGGSDVSNVTAEYATEINLPIPTRNGYTFGGWEDTLTGNIYKNSLVVPRNNVSLIAVWEPALRMLISGSQFNLLIPEQTTKIVFCDDVAPQDATLTDLSVANDYGVVGWLDGTVFYVSSQEENTMIYANEDASRMFSTFEHNVEYTAMTMGDENGDVASPTRLLNLIEIDFTNLSFAKTTTLAYAFSGCYNLASVDMEPITSNVTDMTACFLQTGMMVPDFTIARLDEYDTSNVTSLSATFAYSSFRNFELIQNWETGNVHGLDFAFMALGIGVCDQTGIAPYSVLIDISNWDVSNVANMIGTFSMTTVNELEVKANNLNFENCLTIDMMCCMIKANKLKVDLSNSTFPEVLSATYTFMYNTTSVKSEFYLTNVKMPKCETVQNMFINNYSADLLIEAENMDFSGVQTAVGMFSGINVNAYFPNTELVSVTIRINNSDFSNCKDASGLFATINVMEDITGVTGVMSLHLEANNLNLSSCTVISDAFMVASFPAAFVYMELNDLDLSSYNGTELQIAPCLFLSNAEVHMNHWKLDSLTSMSRLFPLDDSLVASASIYMNDWYLPNLISADELFAQGKAGLTTSSSSGLSYYLEVNNFNAPKLKSAQNMFQNFGNMTGSAIIEANDWYLPEAENLDSLFNSVCTGAGRDDAYVTINAKNMYIPKVRTMNQAFANICGDDDITDGSVNIDITGWTTGQLEDLSETFYRCGEKATTFSVIGFETWDTQNVTTLERTFSYFGYNSPKVIIDLSQWDTSKLETMLETFKYAGAYATTVSINMDGWDTSSLTILNETFYCTGMASEECLLSGVENFDTSNVKGMINTFYGTFANATSLSERPILDLSNWNTDSITSTEAYANFIYACGFNVILPVFNV